MKYLTGIGFITMIIGATMADSKTIIPTAVLMLIGIVLMFAGVRNEKV